MEKTGARRWWALGALSVALLAVGLDLTVLNIALPTLAVDLHASTGTLQWFADAYTLVLAATLLPAGVLGDRYGRRRMLLFALALFGAASAVCAWAPSAGALIAARAVLGLAAAFLLPLSMSVLPVMFTEAERPRAIGIWATANMIGIPIGPIVGGLLLEHYWWGSVFLINIPMAAIGILAVATLVPESRSSTRQPLDLPGTLTSGIALLGVTYGVIRAGEHGWGEAGTLISLLIGVVFAAIFVVTQRRSAHPLVDLALFRSKGFTWGTVLATVVSFAMFGMLFALPQYFQSVNGASTLITGLRLLPMIGGMLIGVRIADRVVRRAGDKVVVAIGFGLMAAGLALGTATTTATGYGLTATWLALMGAGLGFAMPTAMNAAMSPLSAERGGVGSALLMALRQVGGAIGVAVLGAVLGAVYRGGLELTGLSTAIAAPVRDSVNTGVASAEKLGSARLLDTVRVAFTHGMDAMLWVSAGLAALGVLIAVLFLPASSATMKALDGPPAAQPESTARPTEPEHEPRGVPR
ncbi:MAG TPA: MFS transporter [Pseudonocardiaceae bacterium]|jgi:EmrB/QacA subfamily drug resistance transporter|nr:MFS transporter [Pseudonocardiaceae bacterium]